MNIQNDHLFTTPVTLEDGTVFTYINSLLVEKQNRTPEQIKEICDLYREKYYLFEKMKSAPVEKLHELGKEATEIEYRLQDAWGFPRDPAFHRFWAVPRCTCPKMDNEDSYPTGYYAINAYCPVHGTKQLDK